MVKKLDQWREVAKRRENLQIDSLGFGLYIITDFPEHIQFVCDVEHLAKLYIALTES